MVYVFIIMKSKLFKMESRNENKHDLLYKRREK
jgi:hypothetical protein